MSILGVPLSVRLKGAATDISVSREVMDLAFRTVVPGGYASLTMKLHRPISIDHLELQPYVKVYVYDQSGATIWQGRLEDAGRSAGAGGEVWEIAAVGPSAHARDQARPIIYIDTSLERWQEQAANNTGGRLEKIGTTEEATAGKLRASLSNAEVAVVGWRKGWQYNGLRESGQHLARVSYAWDTGLSQADWQVRMRFGASDLTNLEDDVDWNVAGGTGGGVITTDWVATAELAGLSIERLVSAYTAANENAWADFSAIVIRGTIYTTAGTEDTAGASYANDYILASEVVKDLLGRLLPLYDGANAVIATTSFQITQLAYPDPKTPAQILDDLARLEPGYFWMALEENEANGKHRFVYQAWPTNVRYEASPRDGFNSPSSADTLYNAVAVRWLDALGRIRYTRRTNAVQALTDAGITREAYIDISDEMGNSLIADRIGDQFLAEHATLRNAGTLTVRTPIHDTETGKMVDPWEIMPGELIAVRDVQPRLDALNAAGRDGVTIFKIVGMTYSARDNTAILDLDRQQKTMPRLLAPLTEHDYGTWGWNSARKR